MLRLAGVLIPAYVAGKGPYPQHVHLRAIMIDLLANFAQLVHGWAERNIRIVEGWDDLALEGKTRWAYQLLTSLPQRLSTPDEQSKSVRRPRSEPVSVLRPARGRRIRPSQ